MNNLHLNTTATGRMQGESQSAEYIGQISGWDLQFCQLAPGPQHINVRLAMGGQVGLMRAYSSRAIHQLGKPPSGTLAFGLPLRGMKDWLGSPFANSSILPFNSAVDIDGVSGDGFDAFTLAIGEEILREVSDSYQLPVPDYLLAPHSRSVIPPSAFVSRLTTAIACLMADNTMPLTKEQEETLVAGLLQAALAKYCIEDKSSPAARSRALAGALEFIEQHPSDAVTVGDICRATGVAERSLRRAFQGRFGISPKAYIRHTQLSRARDALSGSPTDNAISDVANNLGFWHMGNFARDYRRLFGELPSQTWQTRRGQVAHYPLSGS